MVEWTKEKELATTIGGDLTRGLLRSLPTFAEALEATEVNTVSWTARVNFRMKKDELLAEISMAEHIPPPKIRRKVQLSGGQLSLFEGAPTGAPSPDRSEETGAPPGTTSDRKKKPSGSRPGKKKSTKRGRLSTSGAQNAPD